MSWKVLRLNEIGDIVTGNTPSKTNSEFYGGEVPFVSPAELGHGRIVRAKQTLTQLGAKSARVLPKNSVLICCIGSLGKVGLAGVDLATNQQINSIIVNERVAYYKYVYYYCLTLKKRLESIAPATTVAIVNKSKFGDLKIPLPSLATQKQIAAVLEKADNLRQQSQQMERELNSLAQSVFLDMFGDPVNNTNSFETASIGELAHVQIGPFGSMLHKSDYIPGGIPLINPTHIVDQKIIPNDELTITEEKFNTLPQYHLKYGDIVMGRRGEMGRCAVVTEESQGYFCGTGSLIIRRTSDLVSSEYLASMLSCSSVKSWFERQSLGATMPNLNKGIVSKLRIPIPSQKVNIKYDLAKSKIQKCLKECAKRKNLAEDYFNSLMQRAFKGELDLKDVA